MTNTSRPVKATAYQSVFEASSQALKYAGIAAEQAGDNIWKFDLVEEDDSWFRQRRRLFTWPAHVTRSLGGRAIEHTSTAKLTLMAIARQRTPADDHHDLPPFELRRLSGIARSRRVTFGLSAALTLRGSVVVLQDYDTAQLKPDDIVEKVVRFGTLITGRNGVQAAVENELGKPVFPPPVEVIDNMVAWSVK